MGNSSPQHHKDPLKFIGCVIKHGLYDIAPINKTLDSRTLSMAYSPGVGAVCMAIKNQPTLVDKYTLRERSIAIVTQGRYSKQNQFQGGHMVPILDWCIAQAKFYGGVDCFPFIIRKQAKMANVLKDLSNSYSAIVWLDYTEPPQQIPDDIAFIQLDKIHKFTKSAKSDWYSVSKLLAYIVQNKIRGGKLDDNTIKQGIHSRPLLFKKSSDCFKVFRDGRKLDQHALEMHEHFEGKIRIELSFTNIQEIKKYFTEDNLINYVKKGEFQKGYKKLSAIVTDGTAILGYGDIGPRAGLSVMEGKSLLFKSLGGVDVVPIAINKRQSPQEAIEAILDIAQNFKAINLEDIKAPECFIIEKQLSKKNLLPIFHDDQHGTAIITLAALINAAKVVNKQLKDCKVIVNGAGAAGMTIAKLLISYGIKNVIVSDTSCSIYEGRKDNMNTQKEQIAKISNPHKIQGCLDNLLKQADIFIGVSVKGALKKQHIKNMAEKPIILAMANPDPQITLQDALEGGAYIYGSGRSDYKNQINNSLVFPGIFRALHQHDIQNITEQMKTSVAELIAQGLQDEPKQTKIIPNSLDRDIPVKISDGLKKYK